MSIIQKSMTDLRRAGFCLVEGFTLRPEKLDPLDIVVPFDSLTKLPLASCPVVFYEIILFGSSPNSRRVEKDYQFYLPRDDFEIKEKDVKKLRESSIDYGDALEYIGKECAVYLSVPYNGLLMKCLIGEEWYKPKREGLIEAMRKLEKQEKVYPVALSSFFDNDISQA